MIRCCSCLVEKSGFYTPLNLWLEFAGFYAQSATKSREPRRNNTILWAFYSGMALRYDEIKEGYCGKKYRKSGGQAGNAPRSSPFRKL
jgi:hypothetical protein